MDNSTEDHADAIGSSLVSTFIHRVTRPFHQLVSKETLEPWDENDTEYNFRHKYRGMMVIINNEHFGGDEIREGSRVDVNNLQKTFTKLGFQIMVFHNVTKEGLMTIFHKARKSDHRQSDCFVCVILTHGQQTHVIDDDRPHRRERQDLVYAVDGTLFTTDILELFTDRKSPSLAGKPKLFFVQACRGKQLDYGVYVNVVGHDVTDAGRGQEYETMPPPIYKDFLIMYATPPGFYAMRRKETGSWFMDALCEVLSNPGVENVTLTSLLTRVVRIVALEFQSSNHNGAKQTPCFQSMLTKDVYFRQTKGISTAKLTQW